MRLRSVAIVSSLPLQRLLHFNSYYSVFYAAAEIGLTAFKLTGLVMDEKTKYSLPVLVAVFVIAEAARLPLGYTGNLREKVSELSAFWLLSLFPQLPLVAYLTVGQIYTGGFLPLDLAAGICMLTMLLGELWYGYGAIKTFIRKQTAEFSRLCQEEALLAAASASSSSSSTLRGSAGAASTMIGAYGTALLTAGRPGGGTVSARGAGEAAAGAGPAVLSSSSAPPPATPAAGPREIASLGARHLLSVASSFLPSARGAASSSSGAAAPSSSSTSSGGGVELTSAGAGSGRAKSS